MAENDKTQRYRLGSVRVCHRCGGELKIERERSLMSGRMLWRKVCWKCGIVHEGTARAETEIPVERIEYCPVTGVKAKTARGRKAVFESK